MKCSELERKYQVLRDFEKTQNKLETARKFKMDRIFVSEILKQKEEIEDLHDRINCKFCGQRVVKSDHSVKTLTSYHYKHRKTCEKFTYCFDSKKGECRICGMNTREFSAMGETYDSHFAQHDPKWLAMLKNGNGSQIEILKSDVHCKFCGEKFARKNDSTGNRNIKANFHRKKCLVFNDYIDLKNRTCRICQGPIKMGAGHTYATHFEKNHPEKLFVRGNEGKNVGLEFNQMVEPIDEILMEDEEFHGFSSEEIFGSMANSKRITEKKSDTEQPECVIIDDKEEEITILEDTVVPKKEPNSPKTQVKTKIAANLGISIQPKIKKETEEDEITIIEESEPEIKVASVRSLAPTNEPKEPGEASIIYHCLFCKKIYWSEAFTLKHLLDFHAISQNYLDKFGLKIKATHL